ncbi:MAG: hypothetical protein ACE5K0_06870 [Candidatus Methanofastidiosia archaeon]
MRKTKIGGFLLAWFLVFSVFDVVFAPPPGPIPITRPTNPSLIPLALNAINTALQLKEEAHSLLDEATGKELEVSEIADAMAEADALLEKAQKIMRFNPIAARNMALEAQKMYEKAIADLEELLG